MSITINDALVDNQPSVFSAALPYVVGSLATAAGGTFAAVTTMTSGSLALPVAAAIVALIGAYGFFTTAVIGIYSRNGAEFNSRILPALQVTAIAVITEAIAMTARIVLERLVERAIFGNK